MLTSVPSRCCCRACCQIKKTQATREYFRWDLYWRNREYQALLAYIVIMIFLLVKSFLTGVA